MGPGFQSPGCGVNCGKYRIFDCNNPKWDWQKRLKGQRKDKTKNSPVPSQHMDIFAFCRSTKFIKIYRTLFLGRKSSKIVL